jgi:hypothetical protein
MKKPHPQSFFHEKNRLRSFFMKKNSGASDLFIRQSNRVLTALKAPIGRIAEEPGPMDELLAGHGHPRFFVRDERMPLTGSELRRA